MNVDLEGFVIPTTWLFILPEYLESRSVTRYGPRYLLVLVWDVGRRTVCMYIDTAHAVSYGGGGKLEQGQGGVAGAGAAISHISLPVGSGGEGPLTHVQDNIYNWGGGVNLEATFESVSVVVICQKEKKVRKEKKKSNRNPHKLF